MGRVSSQKTSTEGRGGQDCLKRGTWTVFRLKRGGGESGLGKKKGVVFLRAVDAQMHTMIYLCIYHVKNATKTGNQKMTTVTYSTYHHVFSHSYLISSELGDKSPSNKSN